MTRKPQNRITILRSPIKTFNIDGFDIETYGKHNKFLLGGYYDNKYHAFDNEEEMIQYMTTHVKDKTKIFATNLQFDYTALFNKREQLRKSDIKQKGTIFFKCEYENLIFNDTIAIIPAKVETLGKAIGIPKLNKPTCIGRRYKNLKEKKYLKAYNSQDCKISKMFMIQFQKVLNELGGELKNTIASTSMDLYRRKYIPKEFDKEYVTKFPDETLIIDFIREAYYGGRVEAFKRGINIEKRIYRLYDVNNLYGYCMCKEYPLPSSCKISHYPREEFIHNYHGVSEVTIECPDMYYPFLPYRDKKLIFPTGIFRGHYNHIELRKAIELGYKIHQIHKQIYYTETFYPFKAYVEDLYRLRLQYEKEGNYLYMLIVKTLANSLYGKFGMNGQKDFQYRDLESDDIDGAVLNEQGIGYKMFESEANQCYIMPILASTTTSYGRLELYKYLTGLEGIYCDTDSIITKKETENSKAFGKLKLEKTFTEFTIIRPKLYFVKDIDKNKYYVKTKGVRLADDDVKAYQQFLQILKRKGIKQLRFSKFKESIRRNIPFNTKYIVEKNTDLEDDKRVWSKNFSDKELQDSIPHKLSLN